MPFAAHEETFLGGILIIHPYRTGGLLHPFPRSDNGQAVVLLDLDSDLAHMIIAVLYLSQAGFQQPISLFHRTMKIPDEMSLLTS